ncbi:hypothetical protein F4779DRAFT_613561 [Xylariaceae sp. FL0662B]|nr:hypothetical protein F4779DRAFT_613561 [Xylariaceae sp. FL0662B]
MHQILGSCCAGVKFMGSLSVLRPDDLPVGGTVLCLTDIGEPVFMSMDLDKLRGFQKVFKQSTSVPWVTQGGRSGDPFSRTVVGFGRTIFKLNKKQNDQYNSGRRNITKQIAIREKTVELVQRETHDVPCNICDRASVRPVYNQICQKMPLIAGVAQGAMVLHDTVFSDLDMERAKKVTQPKVDGSTYLEERYYTIQILTFLSSSHLWLA